MGKASKKRRGKFNNFKKAWVKANPPDADGNYICWICKQPVHVTKVSIDHILPASIWPEYAKNFSNIRPAHLFCNEERAAKPDGRSIISRWGRGRGTLRKERRKHLNA